MSVVIPLSSSLPGTDGNKRKGPQNSLACNGSVGERIFTNCGRHNSRNGLCLVEVTHAGSKVIPAAVSDTLIRNVERLLFAGAVETIRCDN